ncbi:hypothetical protein AVEN_45681-1 [Araneus ventricosus]|uniref:Uncharacterized protein n=1 Tax=Araneus ventricosus TaxID=182803 RepID=A0A4Y2N0A1_ARAVE|nr:hypothetical protein AVEN_45681-1 [Araneus ventricosus]
MARSHRGDTASTRMRGCRISKLALVNPMVHYYGGALRAHSDDGSYLGKRGLLHGYLEMRTGTTVPDAVVVAGHSNVPVCPVAGRVDDLA